jgi:GNAT superfamily N-acetyltransferase
VNAGDGRLAGAVEENLFDLFRAMARGLGGEVEESAALCRHLSFPTNPMFKGVWRIRLNGGNVGQAVDEAIEWFKARKAPFAFWWTGADSTPADLAERLKARGMVTMEEQTRELAHGILSSAGGAPCMAADLSRMNEAALKSVPAGFVIEEVRDDRALDDFKRVFVEVYGIPEWAGQAWVDATRHIGIGKTPWKMYVGRLDGEVVATNMLFKGGGVASVYAVAAAVSVRGKGIGGAITLKPLLEARDMGYRHAVLFSTAMGVHAYERIGFRQTGQTIDRYLWRNSG